MKKRILALLLIMSIIASFATGCGQETKDFMYSVAEDVIDEAITQLEEEASTPEEVPEPYTEEVSEASEALSEVALSDTSEAEPAEDTATSSTEAAPVEEALLPEPTPEPIEEAYVPDEDGFYYDVENVVLYLDAYGCLPLNYIKKEEARSFGWNGGNVADYVEDAAIGGGRFGNYDGLLPKADGRQYTECDIDTNGSSGRGAKRLIFSNDGLYFYTEDHYESFTEITIEDGEVVFHD